MSKVINPVNSIKKGTVNSTQTDQKPKKDKSQVAGKKGKCKKTYITINEVPELNGIEICLPNGGSMEQLEKCLRAFFTSQPEKYRLIVKD